MPPPRLPCLLFYLLAVFTTLTTAARTLNTTVRPIDPNITPTLVFIDRIPGYSQLPACAVYPLNTRVRLMWKGCGDQRHSTSYTCMCTDSYSEFVTAISTDVVFKCSTGGADAGATAEALATSAVDIYNSYCADGTSQITNGVTIPTAKPESSSTSCELLGNNVDQVELMPAELT
ncbi:hypothetical protein B0H66DRAFT_530654 [Apodospora peruviana]|uniref:Uncharacterized protein n=1 Tax=Apodospora peruviana TaxID=516989 RepID=A0AAE0MD52_9PEZI|nr:hypothetical protein B0H66DRAFT_530654 [Apodospora peruviana]